MALTDETRNKKGRPKGSKAKLSTASKETLRPHLLKIIWNALTSKEIAERKWGAVNFAPYILSKMPIEQNITVSEFESFLSNPEKMANQVEKTKN